MTCIISFLFSLLNHLDLLNIYFDPVWKIKQKQKIEIKIALLDFFCWVSFLLRLHSIKPIYLQNWIQFNVYPSFLNFNFFPMIFIPFLYCTCFDLFYQLWNRLFKVDIWNNGKLSMNGKIDDKRVSWQKFSSVIFIDFKFKRNEIAWIPKLKVNLKQFDVSSLALPSKITLTKFQRKSI